MLTNERLNRRQLLIGATAGAVGIGAAALSPVTALANEGSGLVGTWDVRITVTYPGPSITVEGATTFAPGGGLVTMDSGGPSTGLGTWAMDDRREISARFMQFGFSPQGTSKTVVTIRGRLSEESIRGTFTFKVYDLQGHLLLGNGRGPSPGSGSAQPPRRSQ